MTFVYVCDSERSARLVSQWLKTRGGVRVWTSADLSSGGATYATPALSDKGEPMAPPHWSVSKTPVVVTSADDIGVRVLREVKRFTVAIEPESGLSWVLTDHSSRRVREEVKNAGENAGYDLDHATQEAVISVVDSEVSLTQWEQQHGSV